MPLSSPVAVHDVAVDVAVDPMPQVPSFGGPSEANGDDSEISTR